LLHLRVDTRSKNSPGLTRIRNAGQQMEIDMFPAEGFWKRETQSGNEGTFSLYQRAF
jgi:hypothetical protein